ncbi:MAG: polyamine ABC transporter substrate-binding protein [Succinivibrionaceae bacterium]|nr:polyamine ABC transporter substrate-binding protein [Ruminobacter sp.]MDY5779024.1 polyamine ABC transporter substrate-binding protein [Succinivibrionaceae bacterium]MEE1340951.1 polyamine ABC transporter substrate-binding protein [Succinivibrionaceae bacterium]
MLKKSLLGALVLSLGFNAYAQEEEQVVHVYNWNESIDMSVIPMFEKQTGIRVIYDLFDSNEVLDTKLLTGQSGYDVVFPGSEFVTHQVKAGVYHTLPKDKIPNLQYLDPIQMKMLDGVDSGNQHAIPYLAGTTGIGYNVDLIAKYLGPDFKVDSWDVIFKPEILSKLTPCGVAVLNAPTEVMGTAMHYLGLDPNDSNPKAYKPAEELLKNISPYVTYFHSSQNINDLANGDICITLGWSGDLIQARNRAIEANNGIKIEYIVPKEGALIFYDMMAIPQDAPHKENAYKFINFIMDPKVMGQISSYTSYSSANTESVKYVDPAVKANPNVFIPQEKMPKMFMVYGKPQKVMKEINKMWNRIKSHKGEK